MLLAIISIILAVAALADGLSTVHFLKLGEEEINPLFGKIPSTLRVFGEGFGLIAIEILIAALVTKSHPEIEAMFCTIFLIQSAVHIYETVRNFKV